NSLTPIYRPGIGSEEELGIQGLQEDNKIKGFGLGKVVSRYIVDCAAPEDEGKYTCKAYAGGESIATPPTLVVVEGEKFVRQV
ncbi:unnamed protein product, partial [Nesidiocoris tenuis]